MLMCDEQNFVGVMEAYTTMDPSQGNGQEASFLALMKNKRRIKGLKLFDETLFY